MQPPQKQFRDKSQLDTGKEFYDSEFGWVRRIAEACPKCKSENMMALLEAHGFIGCTHCSFIELLPGVQFVDGGYMEARKILESLFDEKRVEKPFQARFMPMNFKRN